jgi:hypothetical protein
MGLKYGDSEAHASLCTHCVISAPPGKGVGDVISKSHVWILEASIDTAFCGDLEQCII